LKEEEKILKKKGKKEFGEFKTIEEEE